MASEYFYKLNPYQKKYIELIYRHSLYFYNLLYEFSEYCVEYHILF